MIEPTKPNKLKREDALQAVQQQANESGLEFFHDRWQTAYVTIPVGNPPNHRETWKIESPELKRWVEYVLFKKFGDVSFAPFILERFRLFALYEGEEHNVYIRCAQQNGVLYVDMCNPEWQVLRIDRTGWQVIDDPKIKFRRTLGMTSLPQPFRGGDLQELLNYLNIHNGSSILLLAWLTYALRPDVPCPILALSGVQGSGKSTATKILRSLIDPSLAELTGSPRSDRDLKFQLSNSRLIAMDNLSREQITPAISDTLCTAATGGSHRERKYFTNDGSERLFTFQNAIIVNGIEELPQRPDLLDRAILVHLDPIPQDRRRDPTEVMESFDQMQPQLFGALLDIISVGLRNIDHVDLPYSPRMKNFAKWGVAIETALGYKPGTFLAAYRNNIEDANAVAIEASPIAPLVNDFLQDCSIQQERRLRFHGTAHELLTALTAHAEQSRFKLVLKHPKFPKAANQLSAEISRIEPNLKKMGVVVERSRTNTTRFITLTLALSDVGDSPAAVTVTTEALEPEAVMAA